MPIAERCDFELREQFFAVFCSSGLSSRRLQQRQTACCLRPSNGAEWLASAASSAAQHSRGGDTAVNCAVVKGGGGAVSGGSRRGEGGAAALGGVGGGGVARAGEGRGDLPDKAVYGVDLEHFCGCVFVSCDGVTHPRTSLDKWEFFPIFL